MIHHLQRRFFFKSLKIYNWNHFLFPTLSNFLNHNSCQDNEHFWLLFHSHKLHNHNPSWTLTENQQRLNWLDIFITYRSRSSFRSWRVYSLPVVVCSIINIINKCLVDLITSLAGLPVNSWCVGAGSLMRWWGDHSLHIAHFSGSLHSEADFQNHGQSDKDINSDHFRYENIFKLDSATEDCFDRTDLILDISMRDFNYQWPSTIHSVSLKYVQVWH